MNKVNEEAVRRIQEDQKKAKQVGQDIKKDKATNKKLADFLSFLLEDIKNDTLIKQIYHTFFKTIDQETELTHLRKSTNTIVLVGIFVPFYGTYIKEQQLDTLYEDIWNINESINLTTYITYIKKLLPKYHDNIPLDKNNFSKLLTHIAEHYALTEKFTGEKALEFENTLKNELIH